MMKSYSGISLLSSLEPALDVRFPTRPRSEIKLELRTERREPIMNNGGREEGYNADICLFRRRFRAKLMR